MWTAIATKSRITYRAWLSIGESLHNLLSGPGCGRMIRHIEVQHPTLMMFQHDEHEQHF
jgi:hypothetical protein